MRAEDLQRYAAERTEELPGAELTHPFGTEWDVWKVRGKVFMLHNVHDERPMVTLKADPAVSQMLRDSHGEIEPGYHMNKKHWISIYPGDSVDAALLDDLVTESYLLVVEGLPKRERPVNPETFGRG